MKKAMKYIIFSMLITLFGCSTPFIDRHGDIVKIRYHSAFMDIKDAENDAITECGQEEPKLLHFQNGLAEKNEYTFQCLSDENSKIKGSISSLSAPPEYN